MLYTSLLKRICIIFTNQNTHNIFYYKTSGNVMFEMWSERPHLYLGPTWNTRGRHMSNQPMTRRHHQDSQHHILVEPASHAAFWLGTLAVLYRPCRGLLLSALRLWASHSKDKNRVILAFPGPQLISTEQHVLLECLLSLTDSVCSLHLCLKSRSSIEEAVISNLSENKTNERNKPSPNSRLIINYLVYKNMCPK